MVIKKKKDTFNDYSVELSWGQLNAVYRALENDHADPLADELFAELGWYLQNVPGPGEDEEEYKAAKEAEKEAVAAGQGGEGPEGGELLGQEVEGPENLETGDEPEGFPGRGSMTGEEVPGSEGPVPPEGPEAPPEHDERPERPEPEMAFAESLADKYLERPPGR